MKNPILDDLRRTRERLLADAGGTLEELVIRLREEERVSERRFVEPRPRREHVPTERERADAACDREETRSAQATTLPG